MKGVYECRIVDQTEAAPGVVRAVLEGPQIAAGSKPGQFVNVAVSRTNDPLLRRPFSVHAVYPEDGLYSLLYVLVGRGTALLRRFPVGETVSVVGPLGTSFDLGDSPEAEHVVVAGGCGAAPLHFLCDVLCDRWGCDRVTVLAGARTKDALLCEDEFRSHGVDVGVATDDGSYGREGPVTDTLRDHLRSRKSGAAVRVYSCGPHAMLREVARISLEAGVDSCQVSLENNMACGLGVCAGCVQKISSPGGGWRHERVCADGPVFEAENVIWD